MQALAVPVLKSTLFAALTVGALAVLPAHHANHRLILHTSSEPHALYLSQWMDGDIEMQLDADHLTPLRFEMRAEVSDGCRWLGVETLTPVGEHRFAYTYVDQKLSCAPNPLATIPSQRSGWVEVQ
jgi:hypothetical protein